MKLSRNAKFSIFAVAVMAVGLFVFVLGAQQNQERRSQAASADNLIGNNQSVNGHVPGNLIGNSNKVEGNVGGCVVGDNNLVRGNVGGVVIGQNNKVEGSIGLAECTGLPGEPTTAPTLSPAVSRCNDNIDNDNNNFKDAADSSCHSDGNPNNPNSYVPTKDGEHGPQGTCSDSIDNDNDGKTDGADPDCHTDGNPNNPSTYDPTRSETGVTPSVTVSPTASPTAVIARCNDNIDNDNNNFKDAADSSCHSDGNPNNPNSYVPTKDGEHGPQGTCSDSIDNDNDGKTDGADPDCHTDGNPNNPSTYDPTANESGGTRLSFDMLLHGLGLGGDNANPTATGNNNPLHKTRAVEVVVANSQNQVVQTKTGNIVYASASGSFKGTIVLDSTFATGVYTVKIKTNQFLRTLIPGIQTITKDANNQMAKTAMVNGEVNGDNVINILDYNLLMGCYSTLSAPVSCTAENKLLTDLDDDGKVNQTDYNLFLRELTNLPGQ